MQFRFDVSATGEAAPVRIDREARTIFGVSLIQTGPAQGHGLQVDETMLKQVVDATNATGEQGLLSRFTHPGMCSDGMGRQLGRLFNARVVGDKAVADLRLAKYASNAPDGDLAGYIMDLAEEDPAAFGLSIAFEGFAVWRLADGTEERVTYDQDGRVPPTGATIHKEPFARLTKLRAADAVNEPAANRDGLFSAAFASTSNLDAERAFAQLDQIRDQLGLSAEKAGDFLRRYLAARTTTPTKESKMDAAKFDALLDANPTHAVLLGKAQNAGKSEAEILTLLNAAKSAEKDELLKEARGKITQLQTDFAAEKEAHQKTKDQLTELQALKPSGGDPGSLPKGNTKAPTDDALKAEWSAMSAEKQAEFLGEFETFKFYALNDRKPAAAGKE